MTRLNQNTFNGPRRQPSRAAKQRVRDAFDAEKLKHICVTWDFDEYGERIDLPGKDRFFYYKDNGSDILAIAHLDSVQDDGTATVMETAAGLFVASGTLDDRLGAYVILELLPALGIKCDILLTTDEEIGQSTAIDFTPEHKDYNWMFQFDRGGTDVVMYEYETKELVELVEASGARVGKGSFSDICMLDHLGCAGFNWGVGYQDYHSQRGHAWLEDTFRMVARFVKFYNKNADTLFPYESRYTWATSTESWWSRQELIVADCGHMIDVNDEDTFIEFDGGDLIVCDSCGTMPTVEEAS
jgi:hypothetical protein